MSGRLKGLTFGAYNRGINQDVAVVVTSSKHWISNQMLLCADPYLSLASTPAAPVRTLSGLLGKLPSPCSVRSDALVPSSLRNTLRR